MKHEVLRLEHITRHLHGRKVLNNIMLNLYEGEILGLTGLNGSGKTVLTKIIAGLIPGECEKGRIYFCERELSQMSSTELQAGIYYIDREIKLIPGMTVMEYMFVIGLRGRKRFFINEKKIFSQTERVLTMFGLDISPNQQIDSLSQEEKHIVQICTAVNLQVRLLILDSITGTYDQMMMQTLMLLLERVREQGIAIIYVNNRLDDVFEHADRVLILKDGRNLRTLSRKEYSKQTIINLLSDFESRDEEMLARWATGEEVLRAEGLSYPGIIHNVSFTLHKGEILGLAVNDSMVRSKLGESLFGCSRETEGTIYMQADTEAGLQAGQEAYPLSGRTSRPITLKDPAAAIRNGIGLVREHACRTDLYDNFSIAQNLNFLLPRKMKNTYGVIRPDLEKYAANSGLLQLHLSHSPYESIEVLSDIDRIKLIISRWRLIKPKVLIFINPTLGIDMFAKEEIYRLLSDLAEAGTALLLISSDLEELLKLSSRIIYFCKGQIQGEFSREDEGSAEAVKEKILNLFITR